MLIEVRIQESEIRIQESEFRSQNILNSGFWILNSGFWILDSGFWILDSLSFPPFSFLTLLMYSLNGYCLLKLKQTGGFLKILKKIIKNFSLPNSHPSKSLLFLLSTYFSILISELQEHFYFKLTYPPNLL